MNDCSAASASLDACPDLDAMRDQVFALLPPGRAWQTHDGGPWPGTRLYGFWSAVASLRAYFNARMCAMREQFFCATADEMRDIWLAQYGLPDDCDPFPDLCAKVQAIGGARCEYFQAVTQRKGWVIDCLAGEDQCGARFGKTRFSVIAPGHKSDLPRFRRTRFGRRLGCAAVPVRTGGARFGRASALTLRIRVHTRSSSAYVAPTTRLPRLGRMRFGQKLSCASTSLSGLQCLMERIAPAHAQIVYEVIT